MKKIPCAVIGVGYLGAFHAEKYASLDEAALVGVVDPNFERAQEIAKRHHCQAFTDYRELIGKVAAVSIVAPTALHYEIAHFFLSHGVHVLVEKPITTTVEEADVLIALAREKNVLLQVGHLERFNSAMMALQGILNYPRFIECQRIAPFTPRGADVNVILDLMIHDIDLICSIVQSPIQKISASGAPILTQAVDIANVRLEFENGCVANVTASRAGLKTERRMRIFQSDAYLSINLHEKRLSVYRKGKGEMFPGIPSIDMQQLSFDKSDAIKAEITAFLHSIAHHSPVLVDGIAGRNALKVALDISAAIQENLDRFNSPPEEGWHAQRDGVVDKKILIIAGEASGEERGAELVHAFKKIDPTLSFLGSGGRAMAASGVNLLVNCRELGMMGFGDVFKGLPRIVRAFRKLKRAMETTKPSLVILIDFAGFNLKIAKLAKQMGIPVLFYISPQVWAWRGHRIYKIAKLVDHLAVVFPFEPECYRKVDLPVTYVGHPLTQVVTSSLTALEAKEQWGIDPEACLVGLLPGSRVSEVSRLMPVLVKTAEALKAQLPDLEFILPRASTIDRDWLETFLRGSSVKIHIVEQQTYEAMNAADALVVASGTATLEAALLKKPMVVVYKAPVIAAMIVRILIQVPFVAICNIIAGKKIVPELLQREANPEMICGAVLKILQDETYRHTMISELEVVAEKLGKFDAARRVAQIAMGMLQ